jgi:hypothetical protein
MLDRVAFDHTVDRPRPRPDLPAQDADPATCIAEANRCYLAARRAAGESVRYAVETGQWLQRIQRLVGYGNWLRWLDKNRARLEFSPSSASGYLRLARLPPQHFQRVANLSLREAPNATNRHKNMRLRRRRPTATNEFAPRGNSYPPAWAVA